MKTNTMTAGLLATLVAGMLWSGPLMAAPGSAGDGDRPRVAYLGISIAPLDETLRHHLRLPRGAGLKVDQVQEGSPAAQAGLQPHDIIKQVQDQWLFNAEQLQSLIRSYQPGEKVTLSLVRQGQNQSAEATLGETELREAPATEVTVMATPNIRLQLDRAKQQLADQVRHLDGQVKELFITPRMEVQALPGVPAGGAFLGVALKPVEESLAAHLELGEQPGAQIEHVVEGSPAQKAGLKPHDVITELDGAAVQSPAGFTEAIRQRAKGDKVRLKVIRAGKTVDLEAELTERTAPTEDQWRSVIREQRVVPRIQVLEKEADGTRKLILQKADEDHGQWVPRVRPGAGAMFIDQQETSQALPSGQPHELRTGTVVVTSDDKTVSMQFQGQDGRRHVIVKGADDQVLFEGDLGSEADLGKLPPEVREQIKRVEVELRTLPTRKPAPGKGQEIRLFAPSAKPVFF